MKPHRDVKRDATVQKQNTNTVRKYSTFLQLQNEKKLLSVFVLICSLLQSHSISLVQAVCNIMSFSFCSCSVCIHSQRHTVLIPVVCLGLAVSFGQVTLTGSWGAQQNAHELNGAMRMLHASLYSALPSVSRLAILLSLILCGCLSMLTFNIAAGLLSD